MAIGLLQSNGSNIPGFSSAVAPDRYYTRVRTPETRIVSFGDGYEQRKPVGINNVKEEYTVNFVNRPSTEIDDLEAFLDGLNAVDPLRFVIEDTNTSPGELSVTVVCDNWTVSTPNFGVKSLSAKLRRVYEP